MPPPTPGKEEDLTATSLLYMTVYFYQVVFYSRRVNGKESPNYKIA